MVLTCIFFPTEEQLLQKQATLAANVSTKHTPTAVGSSVTSRFGLRHLWRLVCLCFYDCGFGSGCLLCNVFIRLKKLGQLIECNKVAR